MVNVTAPAWARFVGDSFLSVMSLNLKKRFKEEGIEIPFPYQNIIVKNDEIKETEEIEKTQEEQTEITNK